MALQRKISELETRQRELERQLATKTKDASKSASPAKADAATKPQPQAKADPNSKPISQPSTPAKPDPPNPGIGYGTLAVLAVASILLLFFRLRRSSHAPPATGASAVPSIASPAQETQLPTVNVAPAPQHVDAPATPAAMSATPARAALAVPTGSSGLNVALVGGGMICLVFLLALIVSKIASFTGFS
jgi:hypothetical protein